MTNGWNAQQRYVHGPTPPRSTRSEGGARTASLGAEDRAVVPLLNRLIGICKDGELGFKTAAEDVRAPEFRDLFLAYAQQRAAFASELQALVLDLGGEPDNDGSLTGLMHREWMDVKAALGERNPVILLEECERGEETAVKAYTEALRRPLAPRIEEVVRQQYGAILAARDNVRSLRITRRSG